MKLHVASTMGLVLMLSFLVVFLICYGLYYVTIRPLVRVFDNIEVENNGYYN